MNPLEDPRIMIGALSDLEVRAAAWLCNESLPVTQTHLCNVLHRSDKTMATALYNLKVYQFCTHSAEGWSVTANVTLLGFSLPEWLQETEETEEPVDKAVDTCPVDTCPVDTCPADGFPQEKGRNFSDINPPGSTESRYLTGLAPEEHQPSEADESENFRVHQAAAPAEAISGPIAALSANNPVLPEPAEPDEPVDKAVDTCPVDTCPADTCPADGFPQEKGRNFSDPGAPSSTSSSILTNLKLEENLLLKLLDPKTDASAEPELDFEPEEDPEPELELEPEPEADPKHDKRPITAEKYQECYKTALAAGIWEDKARELAELPHVTPELITHHVQRVRAEGREIPLAIWRIKQNWEMRKPPERKAQVHNDRQKYVTGKYSDCVNH